MSEYLSAYRVEKEDPAAFVYATSAGRYRLDKDLKVVRPAGVDEYRLVYIGRGVIKTIADKAEYGAGTVLLLRPNTPFGFIMKSGEENAYYFLRFRGAGVSALLEGLSFPDAPLSAEYDLAPSFMEIFEELTQTEHCNSAEVTARVIEILAALAKKYHGENSRHLDGKFGIFSEVIREMHTSGVHTSMEHYAELCGMSKSRFVHVFKKVTEIPPHAYQQRIVLEKAKDLLAETNLPVTEVALLLGFSDIYYFSRFFKIYGGASPATYRKMQMRG